MGNTEDNLLTSARRKRRNGEPLSHEEAQAFKEYHNKIMRRSIKVYFEDEDEIEEYRNFVKKDGYPTMSRWFLDKARLGSTGKVVEPEYIEGLQTRIEDLEAALNEERRSRAALAEKAEMYEAKYISYADKYVEITEKFSQLLERIDDKPQDTVTSTSK